MKMKKDVIILIITLLMFFACKENNVKPHENSTFHGEELSQVMQINTILPAPDILHAYTEYVTEKVLEFGYHPKINDSKIVSYIVFPIRAIYTPIESAEKSSINSSHVYFELDGMFSDFELLISEEYLDESTQRYSYNDIDGTLFVEFEVDRVNGTILNLRFNNNKNWFSRWKNCAQHTLEYMVDNPVDGLVCMAFGKYCAGTIAAMCAIAASEGYFQ